MPPNEPATPVVHSCCLCGSTEPVIHLGYTRENKGEPVCYGHGPLNSDEDFARIDAEITRRKSAPTPSFAPAVGEMCEGIPCKNSRFGGTGVQRGKFKHFDETNGEKQAMLELEGGVHCLVLRSSLKPAPAPVEMWGTQPKDDELPETLPAGTRFFRCGDEFTLAFTEPATLNGDNATYSARYRSLTSGKQFDCGMTNADDIDWTRVPRPSQKAVPAQAARAVEHTYKEKGGYCPACNMSNCYAGKPPEPWQLPVTRGGPGFGSSTQPPEPGQSPPDPYAGYDRDAWGISSGSEREKRLERVREILTCTHQQAVCEDTCRLCGATGKERVAMTKRREAAGAFGKPLDRRISAARHANEREAGVKRFDAWVSTRHARKP